MERRSLKKNQGFNGIRTRDLRDTGALLYQLSYEATHWVWLPFASNMSFRFTTEVLLKIRYIGSLSNRKLL